MKIYKYHKVNINLIKSLRFQKHWFSTFDKLNDPHDFPIIDNTTWKKIEEYKKHLVICSFSKTKTSQLMWSHYTDNKWVCLEFEYEQKNQTISLDFNIKYDDEILTFNDDDIKIDEYWFPEISTKDWNKWIFLIQKMRAWNYEKEIRFLRRTNLWNKAKSQYWDFVWKLTWIYFGEHCDEDDIKIVSYNSKHINWVKLYKTKMNYKKSCLEFFPLEVIF
jgi:hypothetical protein